MRLPSRRVCTSLLQFAHRALALAELTEQQQAIRIAQRAQHPRGLGGGGTHQLHIEFGLGFGHGAEVPCVAGRRGQRDSIARTSRHDHARHPRRITIQMPCAVL